MILYQSKEIRVSYSSDVFNLVIAFTYITFFNAS